MIASVIFPKWLIPESGPECTAMLGDGIFSYGLSFGIKAFDGKWYMLLGSADLHEH